MEYIITATHTTPLPRNPGPFYEYIGPFKSQEAAQKYLEEHFQTDQNVIDFQVAPMYNPETFHKSQLERM